MSTTTPTTTPRLVRMARAARRIPLMLLGLTLLVAWGIFLRGTFHSIFAWLALLSFVPLLGFLTLIGTTIAALWRKRGGKVLAATGLLSAVAMLPFAWNFGVVQIPFPYSLSTATPAATVRLPLDGPIHVGWGGDDLEHNHHASFPDQRWAYDLLVEPANTRSPRLEDYGCYGKDVLAPIDAQVWFVHDGEPDQDPSHYTPNGKAPAGNHVVLRLDSGTFLLLAHLQPGSVLREAGQRIQEGQVVGRCGNSGNTSEPHVHIHHQRQDPSVYRHNFGEGLPLYFRDHDGRPMPHGGASSKDGKITMLGDVVQHIGSIKDRHP